MANLTPLGDKVVVQVMEQEEKTASGIFLPDSAKKKPQEGKIIVYKMKENAGFGAAVNAGFAHSHAPFLATINDDASAAPDWLEKLLARMEGDASIGSCASAVLLHGTATMDSAALVSTLRRTSNSERFTGTTM